MTCPNAGYRDAPEVELEFLLRRAEQEAIAAVRSIDPRASERHGAMASEYSRQVLHLLGRTDPASTVRNSSH